MRKTRRSLHAKERCWTTHIYKRLYKNHPPIPFKKTTEIIEEMHSQMIDHLLTKRRPIQIRKSIGYLELAKWKQENATTYVINWPKTLAKGKWVKELNHHTSGYIFSIKLRFTAFNGLRMFKFIPLERHNKELTRRIYAGDVQ